MEKYQSNLKKQEMLNAFREAFKGKVQNSMEKHKNKKGREQKQYESYDYEQIEPISKVRQEHISSNLMQQAELLIDNTALLVENMAKLVAL